MKTWTVSIPILLLILIGSASSVNSQERDFRKFDLLQLQMEATQKAGEIQKLELERINKTEELQADHNDIEYTAEMLHLYQRLFEAQQPFFTEKWNNNQIDLGLRTDIRMIKTELARRSKQTTIHLKRR